MTHKPTPLEAFNQGVQSMLDQRNAAMEECERWKREAMAWREWFDRGAHLDQVQDTRSGSLWVDVQSARAANTPTAAGGK